MKKSPYQKRKEKKENLMIYFCLSGAGYLLVDQPTDCRQAVPTLQHVF